MSVLDQPFSREHFSGMSRDGKMKYLTDHIDEYIETHTPDENDRFVEALNRKVAEILQMRINP